MSINQGQQSLELELSKKIPKKKKGYYLPQDIIKYIKDESDRLTIKADPKAGIKANIVSENDVFVAIVRCHQKTATIAGDDKPAYSKD